MTSCLKLLVPGALALYFAAACTPDLDALSAEYSATAGGGLGMSGSNNSDDGGTGDASGAGNTSTAGRNGNSGGAPAVDTCQNRKQDSNESDVDCGGTSKCTRCVEDARCSTHADCESDY